MFLTKKHLSRRAVLRGMGVTVALPFLDAMTPAQTPLRKTAAAPRTRLACIEMVHGAAGSTPEGLSKNYWSPRQAGADFDFSYALEPLASFREYITIVSGTDARTADAHTPTEGGADHFRSSAVFLTAAHAKQTAGPDISNGPSIDQIYAQLYAHKLGRESEDSTRLPSIQLGIENFGLNGSCGFNYSCIYSETISWASPTEPLPMTANPRAVFENLFGTVARGSVADKIAPEANRLQRDLGATDRSRLDAYLEEVRRIERHIELIEKDNAGAAARKLVAAPLGVPDSWQEHVKLMFDLQVLAFAAEITRVSAFKMSRDTSNRVFPESGVRTPFHTLSHHNEKPEMIEEFARLNRYHVSMVPYFLEKLKSTPDGDGNLLDHSMVLYGSPMGNSNMHNHRMLPLFLAGHAAGQLKGNLHCVTPEGTPHANTLLTMLHKLGVEAESIGDSTGEIAI
jgi:Protein of unknown function (DUF1552)